MDVYQENRASNTIGQTVFLKDAISLYKYLNFRNTINTKKLNKILAINYVCGWHFKSIDRSALNDSARDILLIDRFKGKLINIIMVFGVFILSFLSSFRWIINEYDFKVDIF